MPHFHAYYQDHVGIYDISRVERLAGSLPRRQERLVLAWAELHQEELLTNWQTLQQERGRGSGLVSCYLLALVLFALNHGSSSQSRI